MSKNVAFMKALNWLAEKVIVETLSNSPAFQRFALRTASRVEAAKKEALKGVEGLKDGEAAKKMMDNQQSGVERASAWLDWAKADLEKMGGGAGKGPSAPTKTKKPN